jgi:hypothetical protein
MACWAAILGVINADGRTWVVPSPNHGQTFAFGSEQHRQWITVGRDRHLALSVEFTNDPYVDRTEPRQYDDFIFDFPSVTLGRDGRTFFYHAPGGRLVPVAVRHAGLFGIEAVDLLPSATLVMHKPHGFVSLELVVDAPASNTDDEDSKN